jgi:hypothetical protein
MSPPSFATWESTTTSGLAQPLRKTAAVIVLAAGNLAATGTTSGLPLKGQFAGPSFTTSGVESGLSLGLSPRQETSPLVAVRQLTGLTWDQLAKLFRVSRRSVFLWASGKAMSAENEEFMARLLAFVRWMDRGSVLANHELLLTDTREGLIVLDLLGAGQFDEARARVGVSRVVSRRTSPALSAEARRDKEPPRPEDLLEALQDPIQIAPERVLSTRRIRRPARA